MIEYFIADEKQEIAMIERASIGVSNDNCGWPQGLIMRFFLSYFANFGIVSSVQIMSVKKSGETKEIKGERNGFRN
jgi:hypothetical protein